MFGKCLMAVVFICSLSLTASAEEVPALSAKEIFRSPPSIGFRIGGTLTINREMITDVYGMGYEFVVTSLEGEPFTPEMEKVSLDYPDMYAIDIPIYDEGNQPGGAKTGETALIHVYRDGLELALTLPPGGEVTVGERGHLVSVDLEVRHPVLFVKPYFEKVSSHGGTLRIEITKVGEDDVSWIAETEDTWLTIIDGTPGFNNGTVIVEYEGNISDPRDAVVTISETDASGGRKSATVYPPTVVLRQEGTVADIDNSGMVDLKDAVLALKVLAGADVAEGMIRTDYIASGADVNGDNRIGLEEVFYALRAISGISYVSSEES